MTVENITVYILYKKLVDQVQKLPMITQTIMERFGNAQRKGGE